MKVSRVIHEQEPGTGRVVRQTITIEIEPDDDPRSDINGLVMERSEEGGSRLGAWLQLYGHLSSADTLDPYDQKDMAVWFGFVANMTESRYKELLWIARDTWGWSWRKIALNTELPVTTIRRRVEAVRQSYAKDGYWRDRTGLRHGTPEEAAALLRFQDVTDPLDHTDD